jgi:hypothetical protein
MHQEKMHSESGSSNHWPARQLTKALESAVMAHRILARGSRGRDTDSSLTSDRPGASRSVVDPRQLWRLQGWKEQVMRCPRAAGHSDETANSFKESVGSFVSNVNPKGVSRYAA